jgi:hypothetical protein
MRPRLLALESGSTVIGGRVEKRATIVALSMGGIDQRSIALFTSTHLTTVRRWVCRIEEGNPLTDMNRHGRPCRISEACRLMTISVYCQHTPPLPGVHRWSLRDAQRFFLVITDFGEGYGTLPTMLKSKDCAANYHDIGIHLAIQQDSANHHVF